MKNIFSLFKKKPDHSKSVRLLEGLLTDDDHAAAVLERLKMALGEGSAEIMFIEKKIDTEGRWQGCPSGR